MTTQSFALSLVKKKIVIEGTRLIESHPGGEMVLPEVLKHPGQN